MTTFEQLAGLPPYGDPAIGFPLEWASRGSEGVVVKFDVPGAGAWVGNFAPGILGLSWVSRHPNGEDVLVSAQGALYSVNPRTRKAIEVCSVAFSAIELPDGIVFERQGLAFFKIGRAGVEWSTRRISWDGVRNVRVDGERLLGEACSPHDDGWISFEVCLRSGKATGGSYDGPDRLEWEKLA